MVNLDKIKRYIPYKGDFKNLKLCFVLFCLLNSCGTNEQKNIAGPDKINTSIGTPTHRILKNLEEVGIDPTPEMNISEIMSLSNKELIKLVSKIENKREKYFNHKDENGSYAIINGKKVYHCDNNHKPKRNGTYIRYEFNRTGYLSIFTKEGENYNGIYYNDGDRYDNKKIHKGKLNCSETEFGLRISGK